MVAHKVLTATGRMAFTAYSNAQVVITSEGDLKARVVKVPKTFMKTARGFEEDEIVQLVLRVDESGDVFIMGIQPAVNTPVATPKPEPKPQPKPKVEPKRETVTADGIDYSQHVKTFEVVDKLAKTYGKASLFFIGKSGFGKTSMARALAEHTGRRYVRINCAAVRDPEEWFGIREAKDGSTVFEPTQFSEALGFGGTVICLDEVNRLEPWLLNALFPLLDDDGATEVHGKRFEVAKDTVFVMTINVGWQYTGVFQLDEAFSNRADLVVKVGRLPIDSEERILRSLGVDAAVAKKIVIVAKRLEAVVTTDCSTRATKNVSKLVTAGLSVKEAFEAVIISRLDESETKQAWDIVNAS